jgi:hypothetical protein
MKNLRIELLTLGYCGAIPFLAFFLAAVFWGGLPADWQTVNDSYALGIILFLLGSWWGVALIVPNPLITVLSNALFLFALAAFLWLNPWWPLIAAILFVVMLVSEGSSYTFKRQTPSYRKMRKQLSCIAAISQSAVAFNQLL